MIKQILRKILPKTFLASARNYRTLSRLQGHYRSVKNQTCVDGSGDPVPWYTYPAIEYVKQFDFSDKIVFEFGSGNSTLFWAQRCKQVIAVENHPEWHAKMKPLLPENVEYHLHPDEEGYSECIKKYDFDFDIIIVDGLCRFKCTQQAIPKLKPDGFIILDNSDWYTESSRILRESELIEVDMAGFGPITPYCWNTSFYLSRQVQLKPAETIQPTRAVGGPNFNFEPN